MWKSKDIYYISGSTGILAKDMGKALLCQFPEVSFNEEMISFVRTKEDAQAAIKRILDQSIGRYPLVFSTLLTQEFNSIIDVPEVEFLNLFDHFLVQVEELLETKALRVSGASRHIDDRLMVKRVEAIHYCINHDDGCCTKDYDEAEIILLGVSRSGKTPVSVFLATQMGIKAANYPLVKDDLDSYRLPPDIIRNKSNVVGLSTSPQLLHHYREKRYQGSTYAKLSTCSEEIQKANQIYMNHQIPIIMTDGKSIEETATQVAHEMNLKKKVILQS